MISSLRFAEGAVNPIRYLQNTENRSACAIIGRNRRGAESVPFVCEVMDGP
jgi:hypothetical protein